MRGGFEISCQACSSSSKTLASFKSRVWKPSGRRIPVVVVTALDLSAEDRARLNSGVETVLLKESFKPADLIDGLRRLVAKTGHLESVTEAAS